jgi:hypothetical protein
MSNFEEMFASHLLYSYVYSHLGITIIGFEVWGEKQEIVLNINLYSKFTKISEEEIRPRVLEYKWLIKVGSVRRNEKKHDVFSLTHLKTIHALLTYEAFIYAPHYKPGAPISLYKANQWGVHLPILELLFYGEVITPPDPKLYRIVKRDILPARHISEVSTLWSLPALM